MSTEANIIIDWLKNTDINLSVIARNTGISRKSLYNWTRGGTPTLKKLELLTSYYNKVVERESVRVDSKGGVDLKYVVGLQKQQIESLEAANQKANLENNIWDMLEYDSIFEVSLRFEGFKLQRMITSVTNTKLIAKELNYSEDELNNSFFCIGEWFTIKEHPIDLIMTKETKSSLKHYTDNFPLLFNAMKSAVGDYYIPFNIVYLTKDQKKIQASVFNRVHWREMKIESKVKMFI
tara:strand:- start:1099 stop:1806 length:708 start_codon:yes stop_codon:yes gene_type:complete